jgi:DNA-binding NarL/FixJ family response regulator
MVFFLMIFIQVSDRNTVGDARSHPSVGVGVRSSGPGCVGPIEGCAKMNAGSVPEAGRPPIRILLVDDHAMVRAGLRILIDSWPGMIVVGEAGDSRDALEIATRELPDIVLLDLGLEDGAGMDLLSRLFSVLGKGRVLALSGSKDSELHHRAVRLGVMGVVLKDKTAEELRRAIEKVHAGEVWLDRRLTAMVISGISRGAQPNKDAGEASRLDSLSERERDVAVLVCEGLKNEDIGERLFISETTVRHHLTSIFSKLGVSRRFELVIYLYRQNFAKPGP